MASEEYPSPMVLVLDVWRKDQGNFSKSGKYKDLLVYMGQDCAHVFHRTLTQRAIESFG